MPDECKTTAWDGRPPGDAADVDGWHWCCVYQHLPFPMFWRGDGVLREWGNGYTAEQAAQHWHYIGPCMLPHDVIAACSLSRRLERDKIAAWLGRMTVNSDPAALAETIRKRDHADG